MPVPLARHLAVTIVFPRLINHLNYNSGWYPDYGDKLRYYVALRHSSAYGQEASVPLCVAGTLSLSNPFSLSGC